MREERTEAPYLKSSLNGEANNVVSHLLLGTGDKYEAAWELLTK